ncbi:MAG: homoserine dehydrogenase [Devosiaceae bacterium]|nr:homoserine dehydrogenase [Devosiaceae bacterium MH13]
MTNASSQNAVRVGIAGLGTVGSALARLLLTRSDALTAEGTPALQLTAVSARDASRDRGVDLSAQTFHGDPVALATDESVDVVVELIGGEEGPAKDLVEAALSAGKPVVTANKALLAAHGLALAELAERQGASLLYEAAVAGGIPAIRALRDAVPGQTVSRVSGILNGTCNYILTRMEREGAAFDDVLADAQALGYAEADPTFDVDGFDTAHKLAILTSLAFGTEVEAQDMYIEGIRAITPEDMQAAKELGFRIKLLGVAQATETGIEQRVHPTMLPASSLLAQVNGVLNAVAVDTDLLGEIVLSGPGAGGDATAASVLADLQDVARGAAPKPLRLPRDTLRRYQRARMRTHEGGYYIRLSVVDQPGAFAAIAQQMAKQGISLQSIVQRRQAADDGPVTHQPVIIITHETLEQSVRDAMDAIVADGFVNAAPQIIRIER